LELVVGCNVSGSSQSVVELTTSEGEGQVARLSASRSTLMDVSIDFDAGVKDNIP
jgi:hypothetical protein